MKSRQLPLDELIARLTHLESQLTALDTYDAGSDPRRINAVHAHRSALLRRKEWYLGRIRALKPVEPLGAEVYDEIHTADGTR